MHNKLHTTHSRLYDRVLAIFGFAFILLFILSTKASAATPCTISFAIASDKTTLASGDPVTRTVTVKNVGKSKCRDVSFSMFYGPNETFVSSTRAPRASNYYWYIGALNQNQQTSVSITTKHNPLVSGTEISTEGCAAATDASDACGTSTVAISGNTTVITPPVISPVPVATTTTSTSTTSVPTSTTTVSSPVIVANPSTTGREQGIWVWNFPSQMLSSAADAQLKELTSNGFNAVYITIDDYVDIASMSEGAAKTSAKKTYFDNLSKFVAKANALGIAVDAEGGWRDWAYPTNAWKGFALIDAVKEYNTLYPNQKLRGFQYDVEPYLLPEYETNKAQMLAQYVAFIDQSVQRLVGTDIQFSMAIPHFYDDTQAWTPSFTYAGKTTYAFNHLLTILEKKPGSVILIMSYRDFFEGSNGTRQISETELKEAAAGYHTKVIVSQETGNVDPALVTYYGSTRSVLFSAVTEIRNAFTTYNSFGGTAIHYMDSFLAMSK